MKTLHTIYTSFAKRLAIILTLLLTLGVTSAWGETYEYDFSKTTVWYTTSSKTTNVSNAEDLSKFYDKNGVEWQVSSNPDRARFNSGYFILGKSGAYITLPTFSGEKITSVVITASGGHSTSVSVNIMTNSGTAASTNQTWSTTGKTHTYEISSSYQSSSLRIQVTNAYRTQFTKVTINTESVATAYNVTWNNDGHGTIPSTSPTSASSVTLPSLTATGYAHSGWKANVDVKNTSTGATISANTLISNETTVNLTQATTFTAQWKINSYTVTWKPNGGNWSGNASDKVEDYNYGATITTPSNPTRYGYNFTGWTPTPATTMPASDQTYTAQWTEKSLTNYRTTCSQTIQLDAPTNLSVTNISSTSATLSWGAVENAGNYAIIIKKGDEKVKDITAGGTTCNVTELDANTEYTWCVYAVADGYADSEEACSSFETKEELTDNCRWVEIALEDITPEDEIVVTMGNDEIGYALGTEKITNSPKSQAITIASGMIDINQDFDYSKYTWSISTVAGGYQLQPYGTTKYLYGVKSYITIGNNPTTFTIYESPENDNKCFMYTIEYTPYYLGHGNESGQTAWTRQTSYNILKSNTLKFYKKTCLPANKFWIDYELANVTCTSEKPAFVGADTEIELSFSAYTGYKLPEQVSITMGGNTLSEEAFAWEAEEGILYIVPEDGITGDIVITVEGCELLAIPTNLEANNITSSSATLSWDEIDHATEYQVHITDDDDSTEDIITTTSNTYYEVTGLSSASEYLWGVTPIASGYCGLTQEAEIFTTLDVYTVTFNTNGGTAVESQTVDHGTKATKPTDPTKTGYTFAGWYTEADTEFDFNTPITSANTTLYARWNANQYTITFRQQWGKGGTETATVHFNNNDFSVSPIIVPTRNGYTFGGYYTSESGAGTQLIDVSGAWLNAPTYIEGGKWVYADNLTLYAKWTQNFTITWMANGQPYHSQTAMMGTAIAKPNDPDEFACDDKVFVGWLDKTISGSTNEEPTFVTDFGTIQAAKTYHAVFATLTGTPSNDYNKITNINDLTDGEYVIAYGYDTSSPSIILKAEAKDATKLAATSATPTNNKYTSPAAANIWEIKKNGDNYSIYNAATQKYVEATTTPSVGLSDNPEYYTISWNSSYSYWKIQIADFTNYWFVGYIQGETKYFQSYKVTNDKYRIQLYKNASTAVYSDYVTTCVEIPTPHWEGAEIDNADIAVDCGTISYKTNASTITFPTDKNYDLTYPITLTASEGFLLSTNKQNDVYEQSVTVTPVQSDDNKGKITQSVHVRADATGKKTNFDGTITISGDQLAEDQIIEVHAVVDCPQYTLTFNDCGDAKTITDFAGTSVEEMEPWAETCSEPFKYVFDGWATAPVTNGTEEYEKVDFSTFTMPNNNTTILYAVYRYAEEGGEPVNGYVKVTEALADWSGDYVIVDDVFNVAIQNTYEEDTKDNKTLKDVSVTIVNDKIVSPTNDIIWTISKSGEYYTVYNAEAIKYAGITKNATRAAGLSETIATGYSMNIIFDSNTKIAKVSSTDYNRCFSYSEAYPEWRTYSNNDANGKTGYLYRFSEKTIRYTSSLICGSITAEDALVTSTKDQKVKVKVPITLESSTGATTINATSDNAAFAVTGLIDVEAGNHTIVVEYTPAEYNTTETANITLSATNGATTTFTVIGRSLPEKFAIVAEKDGKYYALPADMPSAGTYAGYEVEVKDNTVVTAPDAYVYSLNAVHNSRYADYGTAVRFVGNEDKCLWASISKNAPTSIRNYAGIDNAKSEQYEWTLTTQDGETYTITSTTTAGRQLRLNATNFGLYASGVNNFRFLPIQVKTYEPVSLCSKFSVAKDKKVQFSAGNLQYHTGDKAWRFAEQQYYYVGDNNKNISNPEFKDWIDMFGWSADGKFGVNTSIDNNDYQGEFVDWGTLFPDEWYTLSMNEWYYLLNTRTNAANLKQLAKIGDVYGVLLFPDDWTMPYDVTTPSQDEYNRYSYSLEDWQKLETAGAVFLPAAGRRSGADQVNTNHYTYYWTSTKETPDKVYYLINCHSLGNDQYKYALPELWHEKAFYGQSVRLVRECIEPEKPQALPSTFSVSATEKVQFSAGNLQYHTGEQVWRFAPEQYDVVGQPNTNIGNPNFKDWVDMFGWSTNDPGNNFGVNPSNDQNDYNGEFVDWGKVFSDAKYGISADEWYTLSMNEWYYLLYTRTNASSLKQVATVGDMIGVLLFPDDWVMPKGIEVTKQTDADGVEYYPYTIDQWKQLEAAGAVFLPAAGRRTGGWGNEIVSEHIEDKDNPDNFDAEGYYRWQDNTNYYGYYWTSTKDDSDGRSYFLITCKIGADGETGNPSLPSLWDEQGRYGQSVRLARKLMPLQVVEWKENSVVVMYNGDPAQTATVTINNEQKGSAMLSKVEKDKAVYELPATDLASSPNQPLEIAIGNAKALMTIPYVATATTTNVVPNNSDLVILKDATFTATDEQLRNVTVYGGGTLVVGEEATLSTNSLTLRAGGVTDGNYDYVYPQFVLNGTWSNTSGKINLDYLTTKEQYYTFVAPFAVNTKDIKYPVDIYGSNVAADNTGSYEFQYYDGAARAAGNTGWMVVNEDPNDDGEYEGATLTAGQGYTFLGMPKKVKVNGGSSTRQKFGIHRIPMTVAAANAMTHENSEQSITVAPHPSEKNNNSGWNLIGNPYMATIGGLTNEDIQVGKRVHTNDANGNWTGGWHWDTSTETTNQRFLVIPSNDGQSYEAVQASNATLHAFKNFFVQIGKENANALSIPRKPSAQLLAPARRTEEVVKDVEVAIVLEQDEAHTDQMDFLINNIYTEYFEPDADFTKMMNATSLNLYGVHPYDNLSFVAIDNNTARGSVAIGYQVPQAGEYTLRMSDKPYVMFDKIEALYVTDHEISPEVTTDIMSEPYRFTVANAETNHTRFTVSVILKTEEVEDGEDDGGGDLTTGVDNTTNNNRPHKFIYQDKMYILLNGVIYDAMGKQVQTINK